MTTAFVNGAEKSNGEVDFYMIRSDIKKNITLHDVAASKTATYKTFEEFSSKAFDIWKVTFPKESVRWKEATCTCPAFDAAWMCKHIISVAFRIGILNHEAPEESDYDDEPLFATKRGRPKKVTKALVLEKD